MSTRPQTPLFTQMIELISAKNPMQRKSIDRFLSRQGTAYFETAEEMVSNLTSSFLVDQRNWSDAAEAYNRLCKHTVWEQVQFQKTGLYPRANASEANAEVYSQPEVMQSYMVGLMLSYLLWPNHVRIMDLYRSELRRQRPKSYCEVGIGHGLFVVEQMRAWPGVPLTLVDISETSINLAKRILQTFGLDPNQPKIINGDFNTVDLPEHSFDLLVMGEILEHVDDAPTFLRRGRQLLANDGRMFLTTCANCPATDHVYHFHNVDEIHEMIEEAGLTIGRELKLPAEEVPEERWESSRVTVNYAAWVFPQERAAE
ncbi:MAG: class I SAM-dependent methyltransferase [Candidatus Korobacteraceae bacterium]